MAVRRMAQRIQAACRGGRLGVSLRSRLRRAAAPWRYLLHDPASPHVRLHCPDAVEPSNDSREAELVDRIFRAFARMKEDQTRAPRCYLPSSLWQRQLDDAYASLTRGLQTNDRHVFHTFLANFGTWPRYQGLEPTTLMRSHIGTFLGRRYLADALFYQPFLRWQAFNALPKPLASLTYPSHGNQVGAYLDSVFVGAGSFSCEIYASMLRGLLAGRGRPVVAELGAGYGKLAFFLLRDLPEFAFIDFDLPETLCVAAYYLMKTWPEKRALLYGEDAYTPQAHNRYDLIFMPSFAIEGVGESSVDLFLNKDSLGEMRAEAVAAYLGQIGRSAEYFFHINHDRDLPALGPQERGLLAHAYPVPGTFRLLCRYPDVSHLISNEGVASGLDRFVYLYQRGEPARLAVAAA